MQLQGGSSNVDCFSTDKGPFTMESTERSDHPDYLLVVPSAGTCLVSSLISTVYGSITEDGLSPFLIQW